MKASYWLLAAGCWLLPSTSEADSTLVKRSAPVRDTVAAQKPWWVGAWAGAATNSPFETRHGHRRRDFYVVALRLGRELDASPRFAYDYYVDVVPLLRQTNIPVEYRDVVTCIPGGTCTQGSEMITETVTGFGLTFLGLQSRIWPANRFQLAFGMGMGIVLYDRAVPDPDERRLNFMGDLSAGVQLRVGRSGQLLAGVRQNHTSNGFTGEGVNPGLDSRVLYVGATRSLGPRPRR